MINTSISSQNRQKHSFYQHTLEMDTLTNCIEVQDERQEPEPEPLPARQIDIKKQIQKIKAKRRATFSLHKDPNKSQLMVISTLGTSKITVLNDSEEDKLGAVFSPFKQKLTLLKNNRDTSIDWERRGSKQDRDQQQNAIIKKTLEVRRSFLAEGLKNALGGSSEIKSYRSNNSKTLSKKIKLLHQKKIILPQNVYLLRLQRLKQLYSVLADMLMSISTSKSQTINTSQKYINSISSLNMEFIDDFVDHSQKRLQKAVRYSRIIQSTGVMYLMLQLLKDNKCFETQRVNLTNMIGHSASNLILLTRMFILQYQQQNFQQSEFQMCIDRYELLQFKQKICTIDEALNRMCHNNEIIQILLTKLGQSNAQFSKILKQFLRKVNRKKQVTASQHTHYLFQFLAFHLHSNELNNKIPFLDIAPNPYLVPTDKPYTIVVQPYGIILLRKNGKVKIRPFTAQFLQFICSRFSVIFWTWTMPQQMDNLLQNVPDFGIQKILYRYHCKQEGDIYLKNLSRLGRDMSKVLLIDYSKQVFSTTPDNGIECGWSGSSQDRKLLQLKELIQTLTQNYMSVQEATKVYNQQINALIMTKFRSKRKIRY